MTLAPKSLAALRSATTNGRSAATAPAVTAGALANGFRRDNGHAGGRYHSDAARTSSRR